MDLLDYTQDFALDPAHVWLNVASEGPLPQCANKALQQAIQWKSAVHLLTVPKFQTVPLELKKSIARLIQADKDDIILGNSATYGLHLLANGISFKAGDEIILLQNDFPTDILPWLSLASKGVVVRQLKAARHVLAPTEIEKAVSPKTRLICLPLIHSFTGFKQDISAISRFCRSKGILCVVNLSQAAGAFGIDLSQWETDAVVCAGYKWLLGPYGTGFCWIKKNLRRQLNYPQNYWVSLMDEKSLNSEGPLVLKDDHSARRYDVFGTANFFNFVPWTASIEYLLSIGTATIEKHNRSLVDRIVDGIDRKFFELISPYPPADRTNIVVFSCRQAAKNKDLVDFLNKEGFHLAFWKNKLRASPHIYNTMEQINKLLKALNAFTLK